MVLQRPAGAQSATCSCDVMATTAVFTQQEGRVSTGRARPLQEFRIYDHNNWEVTFMLLS